ncbi:hypothetical protein CORT_0F01590 [Candida orthopsilosis Co 90-125]|uniref:Uncharacterized protein n=1 Tax=Candida orthopsilosis (strain 90-125) TaxID=1136231 RepID=H8X987_CANO9|nr:hypothetical protein CORT_0F01590 [Candida orthopsilosis Co 90-125]CCG24386.1 hypothetical protein CORT_0F01590 [Candida orthopsilosis Co 90-125]
MIRPTRILLQQIKNNITSSSNNDKAHSILSDAITDKSQLRQLMQDKTWSIKQLLKDRAIKLRNQESKLKQSPQNDNNHNGGDPAAAEITDDLIIKIIGLSGFENPGLDSSRFDSLRHAFNLQKTFLDHLYDETTTTTTATAPHRVEDRLHNDDDSTVVVEATTATATATVSGSESGSASTRSRGNDIQFRLVASDHLPTKPMTLSDLLSSIDQLSGQVDSEKGEFGFDLSTLRSENGKER